MVGDEEMLPGVVYLHRIAPVDAFTAYRLWSLAPK